MRAGAFVELFEKHVVRTNECWRWRGEFTIDKRPIVTLHGKRYLAADIAWCLFKAERRPEYRLDRTCGGRDKEGCVNWEHHRERKRELGLHRRGANGRVKRHLSDDEVIHLREQYELGNENEASLTRKYGVTLEHIRRLLKRAYRA